MEILHSQFCVPPLHHTSTFYVNMGKRGVVTTSTSSSASAAVVGSAGAANEDGLPSAAARGPKKPRRAWARWSASAARSLRMSGSLRLLSLRRYFSRAVTAVNLVRSFF